MSWELPCGPTSQPAAPTACRAGGLATIATPLAFIGHLLKLKQKEMKSDTVHALIEAWGDLGDLYIDLPLSETRTEPQ